MADDRADGADEAFAVHCKAPAVSRVERGDVFAVEPGFFGNTQLVPPVYLRPTGQPRLYVVSAVSVTLGNEVILVPQRRTGADYAHVSGKNIEYLGQLVDRAAAYEPLKAREPYSAEPVRGRVMRGINRH